MGREEFELLKGGVVKRKAKRRIGLFIDGSGLDRATRRLDKKVDLSNLVSGLCAGLDPEIARYYTLVPHEDDARQFAFLDAVERAGLEVVVKRLPPKGVKRQVSMDVHMASDLISFAYGNFEHKEIAEAKAVNSDAETSEASDKGTAKDPNIKRYATIVCPSREVGYAIFTASAVGTETSLADFGHYGTAGGWKGVDRWVDLSTSETIWRG